MKKIANSIHALISPTQGISKITQTLMQKEKEKKRNSDTKKLVAKATKINKRISLKLLQDDISFKTIVEVLKTYNIKGDLYVIINGVHIVTTVNDNTLNIVKKIIFEELGIKSRKDLSIKIREKIKHRWHQRYNEPITTILLNNNVQIDVTRIWGSNTIKTIYRLIELLMDTKPTIFIITDKIGKLPR